MRDLVCGAGVVTEELGEVRKVLRKGKMMQESAGGEQCGKGNAGLYNRANGQRFPLTPRHWGVGGPAKV